MALTPRQSREYNKYYNPASDIKVPKNRFYGFSELAHEYGIGNRPFDQQVQDINEAAESASGWASVEKMPIDALSASHHINREHARGIFKSIKEHGYDENEPIRAIGDSRGAQIINGHHRTIAARAAGYREIPVELISWDNFGRAIDRL